MKEVILTDEQAKVIADANGPVEVRDSAGTILFQIDSTDARALADHRKRKQSGISEPGVPTEQVEAFLQRLEAEWNQSGPFDLARAEEIFSQMNVREE
jgi:hypothetical protein